LVSKLRENLLLHSSYLPLGVPIGLVITTHKDLLLPRQLHATALFWRHHTSSSFFSGAVAGEEEKTSVRGVFHTHILYFVIILLCFIYFTCIALYQKPKKKLESLVAVFTCLL
jgi:hypothetical protein